MVAGHIQARRLPGVERNGTHHDGVVDTSPARLLEGGAHFGQERTGTDATVTGGGGDAAENTAGAQGALAAAEKELSRLGAGFSRAVSLVFLLVCRHDVASCE
ncbi:hypothetical protein [Pseudomonas eucalypticola]|uniref:hypothetical protein n=1 Tax=Pseudomonas eucalypticola TaxID=2599595 RepID=UPI001FD7EC5C|nr:hypothetical protein [Pseudomonas eucalypticola]